MSGRRRIEEMHPEILKVLGKQPDTKIAEKFGIAVSTVGHCRRRHSVPRFQDSWPDWDEYAEWSHTMSDENPARKKTTRKKKANTDADMVVVPFRIYEGENRVDVLHSHEGIRVYHKDKVDTRVTMGGPLPHFDSWWKCRDYLEAEGFGEFRPCLLSLAAAKKVFTTAFKVQSGSDPSVVADRAREKVRAGAEAGTKVTLTAEEARALVSI